MKLLSNASFVVDFYGFTNSTFLIIALLVILIIASLTIYQRKHKK